MLVCPLGGGNIEERIAFGDVEVLGFLYGYTCNDTWLAIKLSLNAVCGRLAVTEEVFEDYRIVYCNYLIL